ncbi:hybrid sensor histidine kinase/response regulator transcription factor [Chitinophaga lutea]|nr:hybrid sensor histidine kinase/response regulator transcription factor [Chitinophaga lutea]
MLLAFQRAGGQSIAFNHLTIENGLSHNSVLSIAQDKRGFMWFGTRYGLNRYDGQRFRIYRNERNDSTSIPEHQVLYILPDSKGNLWIGSTRGLARYLPEKDAFERISLRQANVQPGVTFIYEDRKGRLWIGTYYGLFLKTGSGFRHFMREADSSTLAGNSIRCVFEDSRGAIWVGTTTGLNRLTEQNGQFSFESFRQGDGLTSGYITAIAEDRQGRLWLGTQTNGISLYDPIRQTFSALAGPKPVNPNVRRIITDKAGKMWIGTQEGLSVIDPASFSGANYQHNPGNKKSLSQNSIHALFQDNNGSVWIGTYFGGVNMIHSSGTAFSTIQSHPPQPGLSNNVVSGMLEDEHHNLWIGTEGGGLNYYNRSTNTFRVYRHEAGRPGSIGSNLVKMVYEDKDRNIWAGTHGGGLNLLQPGGTFKQFFFNQNDPGTLTLEVTSLLEDSGNRFWVGCNSGLFVTRRQGNELIPIPDTNLKALPPYVRSLMEDSRRRILIGTSEGLFVYENNQLRQLRGGYINSVTTDSRGNYWVGLYYGGMACFDKNLQQTALYTEKDGLPNSNVIGILEDRQQHLWISTDNGLVKFDPATKKFQTYTTSDGIAGNDFNYNALLKDSRGEFFFGGFNGITSFFPEKIAANTYSAPMVFTGLRLFNKPVGIGGEERLLRQDIGFTPSLRFRPNQEVFTLEFALLNYIRSNKNRYAYQLEGVDRDWIETTTPAVTYTNLAAGSYTFWVKGANNDGVWSEPVRMEITILPPFWRTWWAYCIYALLAAGIFFFVTRYFFLQALLKKEEDLHQVKLNFFTNVSHEIRTHLTLLMAPVEKMISMLPTGDQLQQPLGQVRNNANRLLRLVSELMDFRKAETSHLVLHVEEQDLIPFLAGICENFRELSLSRQIKISFSHDMAQALLYFDREQLDKVFFNLLSNAIKFTPDGGRVSMHVARGKGSYIVTVTDNGRGIAPEYLPKLFTNFFQVADHGLQNTGYGIGLALSRNIVELHHGSLSAESDPPEAGKEGRTCFTVTLAEGRQHFAGTPHVVGAAPVRRAATAGETDVMTATVAAAPVTAPGGNRFTIHIIEDNPELRELVRETFNRQYEVLESENGAAGLALAAEQIPDLVISDVMMPEMDGLQLCHALKTDERTSHIPVILLTAKSSQSDQVSGLETGADLYLTKPFSTRVLELNVRNLLASREKMREKFSRQLQTTEPPVVADAVPNTLDSAFLEKVMQLVDEHMDDPEFGVDMLSRKVAMSQPVLYKKLKAVTDMSVNDFVKSLRLKKAAELIRTRRHTVYEVAYMVGYNDRKYFSREFKKQFGKTPSEFAGEP